MGCVCAGLGVVWGCWLLVAELAISPKKISKPNPAYINILASGFHPAGSFLSSESYQVSGIGWNWGSFFSGDICGRFSMALLY